MLRFSHPADRSASSPSDCSLGPSRRDGIPSVCVAMNRDIIDNVKAPRALFVRFPYGAPLGPAGDAKTQLAVIREALALS